ncbi:MAG: hypothetical protein DRP79_02605 [Planctomycetota bacterium]|nr:MAG: hypothetical protein DRP79_02605 [Planctomycetota bacterium]
MMFRAKYVVQSAKKFFENGAVRVESGRIADIGSASSVSGSGGVVDFGECAIVPGFVNAHTHLQLSALSGSAPHEGTFADWLRRVVELKRRMTRDDFLASTSAGIRESIETGTATLANVAGDDTALKEIAVSGMRCFAFLEVIALEKFRAADTLDTLGDRYEAARRFNGLNIGVAPHAPYTVSAELMRGCVEFARKRDLPLSLHAAETAEEAAFLHGHDGSIAAFLRDMEVSLDDWEPPRATPVKYLASLGVLSKRTLLVHCNYLTQDEIKTIKESGGNVIYCPRSSAFFGHVDYPLRRLLDARVNVALGTDSLASNDSLSVLDEVKCLARRHRKMFPAIFWEMATINGAKALGIAKRTGTLEKKKSADMAVISVEGCSGRTPLEMAVEDEARVVATIAEGRVLHDAFGMTGAQQGGKNA